jgi:thymidylate synthase ThyX
MPSEFLPVSTDIKEILQKAVGEDRGMNLALQYETHCESANFFYRQASDTLKQKEKEGIITNLEYKRVREFLRGVLPQHNFVERVSVMNLRSWCNFYKLRSKSDAQPEIQEVAKQMLQEIRKHDSIKCVINALEQNNWTI